jgi:hypothetical protein
LVAVLFVLILELGAVAHQQVLQQRSIHFINRPLLAAYRMWNGSEAAVQLLKTSVFKRLHGARKSLFGSSSSRQLMPESLEMTECNVVGVRNGSARSPRMDNSSPMSPRRTGLSMEDATTEIMGTAGTVFLTLEAAGDLRPNETQQFQHAIVFYLQQYSPALRATNISVRRLGNQSPMVLVVSLAGSEIDGETLAVQLSTDIAAGLMPSLPGYGCAPRRNQAT